MAAMVVYQERLQGAGVYCENNATFINCTFTNNQAYGGYGGYGGNAGPADPRHLLRWRCRWISRAQSYCCTESPKSDCGDQPGGLYRKWWWSLCCHGNTVSFIGCTGSNNITRGSVSGQGGLPSWAGVIQNWPRKNFRIQSFGAGIYCSDYTNTTFTDCIVQGNRTIDDPNQYPGDPYPRGDYAALHTEFEEAIGHQYTGIGGGMCFDGDPVGIEVHKLHNCNIVENFAPIGGGISGMDVNLYIYDCNIIDNSSEYGSGVIWSDSTVDINSCTIRGNIAEGVADYSTGAGLYCLGSSAIIRNCVLTENEAEGFGAHFSSSVLPPPEAATRLSIVL